MKTNNDNHHQDVIVVQTLHFYPADNFCMVFDHFIVQTLHFRPILHLIVLE